MAGCRRAGKLFRRADGREVLKGLSAVYAWRSCLPTTFSEELNVQAVEKNLVGASGFEPPTSWSRTRMTNRINNLDVGIVIETDLYILFLKKKWSGGFFRSGWAGTDH